MAKQNEEVRTKAGGKETGGKHRASRIPLDYYHTPSSISRTKFWLSIGAVLLCVLIIGGAVGFEESKQIANHGELCSAHAAWETQCDACHVPYRSVKREAVFATFTDEGIEQTNAKCQACHLGPAHHENQKLDRVLACASCHRDHQGRMHNLDDVTNANCVSCHGDLEKHRKQQFPELDAKRPEGWQQINDFANGSHPQFARLSSDNTDPGAVKFNHHLHDAQGLGINWTYGMLPADVRDWYRNRAVPGTETGDNDVVAMSCEACHEFEQSQSQTASIDLGTSRGDGTYYPPVVFERHCKACHPLDLPMEVSMESLLNASDDATGSVISVPHGLQPVDVAQQVRGAFLDYQNRKRKQGDSETTTESATPSREIQWPWSVESKQEATTQTTAEDEQEIAAALAGLFKSDNTCTKCHYYNIGSETKLPQPVGLDEFLANDKLDEITITKANIPQVWFPKAKFNHASHRALDCRGCHAGAYAPADLTDYAALKEADNGMNYHVLNPGIENCLACHAPSKKVGGQFTGGAAYNCTLCHYYHDADHQRQPPGDKAFSGDRVYSSASELLNILKAKQPD